MDTINGSVALVTGASSGIGEGIAKMLADEGVKVALVARRQNGLDRVAGEIHQKGGTVLVAPADLRDEGALRAAVDQTQNTLGPIDILVNSGGTIYVAPIHETDMQAWDANLDVNLRGPVVLCSAVLPGMRARKRGYIFNIASEAGAFVFGGMGSYVVSKHALRVLTELILEENRELGIKPYAICPGFVDTPLADWAPGRNKRNFLTVEEVVSVVRFLLRLGDNVIMGPEILIRTARDPSSFE